MAVQNRGLGFEQHSPPPPPQKKGGGRGRELTVDLILLMGLDDLFPPLLPVQPVQPVPAGRENFCSVFIFCLATLKYCHPYKPLGTPRYDFFFILV